MFERATHWQKVFAEKTSEQVSWFQEVPALSLKLLKDCAKELHQTEPSPLRIIDVGAGDSRLVDSLLEHLDLYSPTVLDISSHALQRAQERLGARAAAVTWLNINILDFRPGERVHIWHDRAAFHFLTEPAEQRHYAQIAAQTVLPRGFMILGAFAQETGPEKCSGLPVCRHSPESLQNVFGTDFWRLHCVEEAHLTPAGAAQNFVFCVFQRNL